MRDYEFFPFFFFTIFLFLKNSKFILNNFFFVLTFVSYMLIFSIVSFLNYNCITFPHLLLFLGLCCTLIFIIIKFGFLGPQESVVWVIKTTKFFISNESSSQHIFLCCYIIGFACSFFDCNFSFWELGFFFLLFLFFYLLVLAVSFIPIEVGLLFFAHIVVALFFFIGIMDTFFGFFLVASFGVFVHIILYLLSKTQTFQNLVKDRKIQNEHLDVDFKTFAFMQKLLFSFILGVSFIIPVILLEFKLELDSNFFFLNLLQSAQVLGGNIIMALAGFLVVVRIFIVSFCNTVSIQTKIIIIGGGLYLISLKSATNYVTGNTFNLPFTLIEQFNLSIGLPSFLTSKEGCFDPRLNITKYGYSGVTQMEHDILVAEQEKTGLTPPVRQALVNGVLCDAVASSVDIVCGQDYAKYINLYKASQTFSYFFFCPFERAMTYLEFQSYNGVPSDNGIAQPERDFANLNRINAEISASKSNKQLRSIFFPGSGSLKFSQEHLDARLSLVKKQMVIDELNKTKFFGRYW